jgi:hypothetical protein
MFGSRSRLSVVSLAVTLLILGGCTNPRPDDESSAPPSSLPDTTIEADTSIDPSRESRRGEVEESGWRIATYSRSGGEDTLIAVGRARLTGNDIELLRVEMDDGASRSQPSQG